VSDVLSARPGKLRLALVGCGRIARLHCERVAADSRATIAACFDPVPGAAQALQSSAAPTAVIYSNFESLIDRAEFNAAIIASPTHLHFEQATALLSRGVPVLCEKPLARTREEIIELVALSGRSRVLLAVAYQRRMWAVYRALRGLVRSGQFGPVRAVLSHNVENWQSTIGGTWRDDPRVNPGGFIGDAGSHKIDVVFFATGLEPTEVFARADRCGSHVEITASVSAMLSGNVLLTMDFVGNGQYLGEILAIHCERADFMVRDGELWRTRDGRHERLPVLEADSSPVTAFLDTILHGADNFAPPECALPVFDFTQGLLASARDGCRVSLGSPRSAVQDLR
jgi:predicted dehydrogenase